jgi:uncharacterized hydrophobic protein (TIGR00341 family)
MSLRLMKVIVGSSDRDRVYEILDEHGAEPRWCLPLEGDRVIVDVILPAAGNEPILDDLENAFRDKEAFRLVFLPLEATVPRIEEKESEEDTDEPAEPEEENRKVPVRINREELYEDIAQASRTTRHYLVMVALSAVVACAGLILGDGAVIIGAMVIAPLIGPNIGVAFATTLGDLKLGRRALQASLAGVSTAFVVSLLAGFLLSVDPTAPEVMGRTRLTYEHLALALAAGAAGAIAMAQGVGVGLVGVMVAVALLPPLANGGLLLGDGHTVLGLGALVLVLGNVVCVNLAATATFLIQGVRPNTWWDEEVRSRAVWTASILWGVLLVGLMLVVWLVWGGEAPSIPGVGEG